MKGFAIGLGILAASGTAAWSMQNHLIYRPGKFNEESRPNIDFEEIWITTRDNVKLHAWFFRFSTDAPTLIYFHGNGGCISDRTHFLVTLHKRLRVNILIVDYRGYGKSEGSPSESGLMMDAEATIEFVFHLLEGIDTNKIFILGKSLGGAVTVYGAIYGAKYGIKGIILENTFTTLERVVSQFAPSFVVNLLLSNYWRTIERIPKVECPILFIAGLKDTLIPAENSRQLKEAARVETEIFLVQNGKHHDTWNQAGEEYFERIEAFVERY